MTTPDVFRHRGSEGQRDIPTAPTAAVPTSAATLGTAPVASVASSRTPRAERNDLSRAFLRVVLTCSSAASNSSFDGFATGWAPAPTGVWFEPRSCAGPRESTSDLSSATLFRRVVVWCAV